MNLAVIVCNNDELAATMLRRFTEVLGRTMRDQLLQLLLHFIDSFLHWLSFKMNAEASSIAFNQLLESIMRSTTTAYQEQLKYYIIPL
ncbi:hypothetical protein CONCODRAFT_12308 [Conidiobolus coronatus NRRL 28638]|uniref:Uncharacterized protein n=1 Tax=Conidiobolus coronatus (strain ATCC 28846 / CBS 209.66 / NRRL 28638) TaxID=796925 RepID=A0A137NTB1_CONC2|nr:hypothetical protein CONCODRAFT_12308 [Conidiobolus coronatus NRRL 28638]|eukprot:KXN65962.1 hypothetical protein CONCODRAFT_12308 [Conidiobolus coronatus NRRL 28638]